ncbi:hypothetical protein [Rhodoblastus sp.]|jgi:hypothetical protein|uniref:hypothetical protein n=1 Tax=Rhodoblastus sp. TaxID=1962975 RepID=UPI0025CCC8B2|nr:hypothetical protein [Rhodoblastus sp.]
MLHLLNTTDKALWEYFEGEVYDARAKASSPKNTALEERLEKEDLPARFSTMDADAFRTFLHEEYLVWKFAFNGMFLFMARRGLLQTPPEAIEALRAALAAPGARSDKDLLRLGTAIRGMGVAAASGLLSLTFPGRFGTVDNQALFAFHAAGKFLKVKANSFSVSTALEMFEAYREKAAELNHAFGGDSWTARRVDRALWAERGAGGEDAAPLNAMETAAEAVCDIFNTLSTADKEALTIRLVTIGSLHSGEGPDYIERVCNAADSEMRRILAAK